MKKIKFILVSILIIIASKTYSQVQIKMQEENGIYTMPCEVNGLKLRFIFDTGASDISISLIEAIFMLKNGYLEINDIVGSAKYQTASGEINIGTIINLREVNIEGLKLHNVQASVVTSMDAPLLLGQSALNRLGKIQFDYEKEVLTISNDETISPISNNSLIINEYPINDISKKEITFNKELEEKALKGDISSQITCGDCYYYSKGVKFDIDSALFWYVKAKSQGSIEALHKFAVVTQYLIPCSSRKTKLRKIALKYYKKAASGGYIESQYLLGLMYFIGNRVKDDNSLGIKQNYKTAFYYFLMSAEQEHPASEYQVGDIYYNGHGIKKDYKQAFFWFSKAAQHGIVKAQTDLGLCYHLGYGTLISPEKAIFWWQKAAEADDEMAQFFLGVLYFNGIGINKSNSKAAYWIERSFKNGNETAKDFWEKNELWKY